MMRENEEEEIIVEIKELVKDDGNFLRFPDYPDELLKFEEDLKSGIVAPKKLQKNEEKQFDEFSEAFENQSKLSKDAKNLPQTPEKNLKFFDDQEKEIKLPEKSSKHVDNQNQDSKLLKSLKPLPMLPNQKSFPKKYSKLSGSKEKLLNFAESSKSDSKLTRTKTYEKIDKEIPVNASKKLPADKVKFSKLYDPETLEQNIKKISVPIKPIHEAPDFRRSLSKHRQDAVRTQSTVVDPHDVLVALTASQEKLEAEKPKIVRFVEKPKPLLSEPSRDSDEIATIIGGEVELPWQKKHQYRTVTPFFKPKNKEKAEVFRPIELSRSTEEVNLEILKPVPIFASTSFQELPRTSWDFKPFDHFQTKSSDDLLLHNIDGVRKPESKRHRLMRIRSESNGSLNTYENFHCEFPQPPIENFLRRKPPQPLPRASSKTIVYVLDKDRDEFVLENPSSFDEVYEDVQWRSSDSILFNSLADNRDDRKWRWRFNLRAEGFCV